jgi:DNA (cytosine-5)-methyltransferase 1
VSLETIQPKEALLADLREHAASATHRDVSDGPSARVLARGLGETIASDLDGHWRKAATADAGPIEVIDLFSGCGGMSAGFHAVNGAVRAFRLALAIDVDTVANETYSRNLPLEPTLADVRALASNADGFRELIGAARRSPDGPLVLIGCAPCQGFSSHRNDKGAGDGRNSLFGDFARLAVAIKPDAIVVENVPELLTDGYWPVVADAADLLRSEGYQVYIGVHNMAEFGVPQERFRAVLLAMRRRFVPPHGFLARDRFRTVRSAIARLPEIRPGEADSDDPMHYTARHRESTVNVLRAVAKDGGNRPADVGPACLTRIAARQGKPGYEDVYGRLAWDRPAVTITNYARNPASGRFGHPEQDRGLSVREAALLQAFPRDYSFAGTLDPSFRQIGNAVPPAFAAYLACAVLGELLDEEPSEQDIGVRAPVGASFSRLIPALKAGTRRVG